MDETSKGDFGVTFRKTVRKDSQTVSLDADMIRVLLVIEESKNIHQLAAELDMGRRRLEAEHHPPHRTGPGRTR